jgi:phenylacetate-CoA ligase
MKITPLEQWISTKIGTGGTRLTREALQAYQLERLRETITRARSRSLFYREHLAGTSDKEPACLEDLARLPFTTSSDLTLNYLRFLCVSQSEIKRVVTLLSSGTTGTPKRICFTPDDQELTIDFFHHGMTTLVGPGDRTLILFPGERSGGVADLLVKGLERAGVAGTIHGPVRDARQTVGVMNADRITSLVGTPIQVLSLALHGEAAPAPRSVLLSTDYVPESIMNSIERIWGCRVLTHYGMTEMGFGGGVECDARTGYHMREADLFFEVVHPETGDPVEPGEWGEIVFTTLTHKGMPLIRYRTGDISRFIQEPCPCGTVLKTMSRVRKRLAGDVVLAKGITLNIAEIDEALFRLNGLLDFSAELTGNGRSNCLQIYAAAITPSVNKEMETAIMQALDTVIPIKAAKLLGILDIAVRTGTANIEHNAKRALADKRWIRQ